MENRLKYYTLENCAKIIGAIEYPGFRIWKIIDEDNRCYQNKRKITSSSKLYDFIHQCKNPKALYVSISSFLTPESNHGNLENQKEIDKDGTYHYPRAGYITASNILLDSYFFIDLDAAGDLRLVQKHARKIIKELSELKLHSINFSGNKGIHLIYKVPHTTIASPYERIQRIKEIKAKYVHRIKKLNIELIDKTHEEILKDVYRVYAAPYSIKESGNMVQPINKDDFMEKDIFKLISLTTRTRNIPREPKGNDSKGSIDAKVKACASPNLSGKERAGISSYQSFKFVDNMVNGLKNNYITVIQWKSKDTHKMLLLPKLQATYKLSDFYIERIGDYIYAYNTKLVTYRRLMIILKAAKSENIKWLRTRKHLPIIVSSIVTNEGIEIQQKHILTLSSKYGMKDMHSSFHSRLFNLKYDNVTGNVNKVGTMKIGVNI